MSDRAGGVLLLLIAVWFGLEARSLEVGFLADPIGPKAFPVLLALLLGPFSVYLIVRPDPEPAWPAALTWLNVALVLGSFVAYAYLLVPLGFIVATTLEVAGMGLVLGARPLRTLPAGLALSLALYALFVYVLGIPLPAGKVWRA